MTSRWAAPLLALLMVPIRADAQQRPPCFALVAPRQLAEHSGHPWRAGAPIWIQGDIAVCHYYQEEVPGGLSLAVRNDPEGRYFRNARDRQGDVLPAAELGGEAFYFRLAAAKPFEPSWGAIVHAQHRTYRIDGVPEAGDASKARALVREIMERALKRY